MGSTIISKAQAAKYLSVSIRTIYNLISKGILHTERAGRNVGVFEEEVLQLRDAVGIPGTSLKIAFNPTSFAKLYGEVQHLKSRLHTLERIYDIKSDRLGLPDDKLYHLFEAARTYSSEGWPPHVEQGWADTFLQLGIDDLRQLHNYLKDNHPWKPFYLFCTTMIQSHFNKYLKDQLEAGRHHLKAVIYHWCQEIGESPRVMDTLMRHEAEPMQRLINKLNAMKDPSGKGPS